MKVALHTTVLAAATLALFATTTAAKADVSFTFGTGTIGGGNDNNVLFTDGIHQGTTVTGMTQQEGVLLSFTSVQQLLAQGGQATLDAPAGAPTNGLLTQDITIDIESGFGLTYIEFLPFPNQGDPDDQFQVTAFDQFGGTYMSDVFTGASGNRILSITANGQLITSLFFDIQGGQFEDLRQIRVESARIVDPIPEPGAVATGIAMFGGVGLGLVRARLKRRGKSGCAAAA